VIKLRALDWAAIAANVLAISFFSWYAYGGAASQPMLYIQNESGSWVYPLDTDGEYRIPGPLGETLVILKNGEAHVEDSPCRDKLCVYMGSISRRGGWIACLPNRVFLRVDDREEEDDVDASVF